MNPEQILNTISEQLTHASANHTGSVLVCIADGQPYVRRDTDRGKPVHILARYKAEVVRDGLTSDEWQKLSRKIAKATETKE